MHAGGTRPESLIGWICIDKDIIELQLAHEVSDANGRAYNRTEFVLQRQEMMQVWADYLDDLHDGHDDYRRNAALPAFTPVTSRLPKMEAFLNLSPTD